MPLCTMPLSETSRSRNARTLTPSVPKSWATDVSSPFTSLSERVELQGQDCNAISISKKRQMGDQRQRL
eukprot:6025594-Alexandrium_andersonii.AAC.1